MAYATVDELAAALRISVTPANQDGLQACLDAATVEIDAALDRVDSTVPLDAEELQLCNRVNIVRGVEWFKSNDAAFGVIGMDDTGALQAPRNGFRRHRSALRPLQEQWGVA